MVPMVYFEMKILNEEHPCKSGDFKDMRLCYKNSCPKSDVPWKTTA